MSNIIETTHDYELVRSSLAFLTENWRDHPSLETLAEKCAVSPHHLQRIFTRWAGLSPKAFLQAITIDHARELLRDSASILDTAYEVGLSGPGRLHDLFVTHEGMSPGLYKAKGRGLTIHYGFHDCPFGRALIMVTAAGLCGLAFADPGEEPASLKDMMSRWPEAIFVEDIGATASYAARIFETGNCASSSSDPISKSASGKRSSGSRWARRRPIPRSPVISASPRRRAPSARRWARTPSPSSCPATACWENPGASAAITGA
jgi:AraC-like DNA-binding protein